ncbi:MAG: type IV pilus modification PilV family protein [Minisyncoccia bacterium]
MKKNHQNKGIMIVEAMVAIAIITASILASMAVTQKSVYVSRQSFHTTQAAFLLEEGAEAVRIFRDNGWTNISSLTAGTNYYPTFSSGTWNLSATPNAVGIFTRTVSMANVNRDGTTQDISAAGTNDPGTKLVTVTVSWPEGGVTITKNLKLYIADIFP